MGKRNLLILLLCLLYTNIMADMPGNKPRPGSLLHLNNIDTLKPYTLMIQNYQDGFFEVTKDTDYNILGGYGARRPTLFFALKGNQSTDTVYLDADEYGREIKINFIEVVNNRLIYSKEIMENGNEKIGDNSESNDTSTPGGNFLYNNIWLIGLSFSALVGLIAFFVLRNRNIKKVDHGDV